ncbi:MAG: hypothetical protein L6422_09565 [Candidatus Marinimicrobia bacterium]|nr:hypothetical protein [bacterium]MCG2716503.1 hypothetical protein [Candidatus Neomarinimicrobiota bacterium]
MNSELSLFIDRAVMSGLSPTAGWQAAGYYSVQWAASKYSSGVYIYRIQVNDPANGGADGFSAVKKCILLK